MESNGDRMTFDTEVTSMYYVIYSQYLAQRKNPLGNRCYAANNIIYRSRRCKYPSYI